jgi:membrane-associated phospholipid phosphatase
MSKGFLRSPFVAFCLAMLMVLAYPVLFFQKGTLVLLINEHHHVFLDVFFKYITHLGDGAVMAALLLVMLFYSYKMSIITTFAIIFQSLIVSVFKRWLFEGLPRPTVYFERIDWHFVEGVTVHGSNTFPSGHTTTAFAFCALLLVVFSHRHYLLSILVFFLALMAGLSRIYLLQHFLVDVYFGAIFGVLSVVLALMLTDRLWNTKQLEQLHKKSLSTTLFRRS